MDIQVIRAEQTWQQAGAYYVRIQGMARQHGITLRREFDEHDAPETKYIVLTDGDFPVATCRFYPLADGSAMIGRVVVLPEYRGAGLGRRVVCEAEAWLSELNFKKAVVESRDVAVGFYRRLGYGVADPEIRHGDTFDCIRMEKEIGAPALSVRDAKEEDLGRIMEIYGIAQDNMIRSGNPKQWGHFYPTEELITSDIRDGICKVICSGGAIRGVFALLKEPEPSYGYIENGAWLNGAPYLTVHRVAGDGTAHGILKCAADFCRKLTDNIRIDTHEDNKTMQRALENNGFVRCGKVYLADGSPRIAYQWTAAKKTDPGAAVRSAGPGDAARLREIYAYYVEKTAVTFEYDVPTEEEFRARIGDTLEKYPYLVLEKDGAAVGYAYAGPLKNRAAYARSCEVSVYLDSAERRKGYGRMLYEALEAELEKRGILNLYACIGCPVTEDEYLTHDSERFHGALGFRKVGEFHKCGYKFGRWYDVVWMEKTVGERNEKG